MTILNLLSFATLVSGNEDIFNISKAFCYDKTEVTSMDTSEKWDVTEDPNHGFCYDNEGVPYEVNSTEVSCCGCLQFSCMIGHCSEPGMEEKIFAKWHLAHIDPSCCQDCAGAVYPRNEEVMKSQL